MIKMTVFILLLVSLGRVVAFESCPIQGPSMLPLLEDRERVIVFKLPFLLQRLPLLGGLEPARPGDLLVFESSDDVNKRYIKRVIAAGPSQEPRRVVRAKARDHPDPCAGAVVVRFDAGTVYVNNRRLEEKYLLPEEARAPDRYQPVYLESGEYYVLGDHRSNSKDSRHFGPVTHRQVIGKAVFRFWPPSKFGPL